MTQIERVCTDLIWYMIKDPRKIHSIRVIRVLFPQNKRGYPFRDSLFKII